MDANFIILSGDAEAERTAEILTAGGFFVRHANAGQYAESKEIAVFSVSGTPSDTSELFKNRYLRCAAHQLLTNSECRRLGVAPTTVPIPGWVYRTPFRVAIRYIKGEGYKHAVLRMAHAYFNWNPYLTDSETPWVLGKAPTKNYLSEFAFWQDRAKEALKLSGQASY